MRNINLTQIKMDELYEFKLSFGNIDPNIGM